jgi:uncharacterized protein YmfQ (DUF2313 family)
MSGTGRTPAQVLDGLLAIGPQGDGMPTTPDTNYAAMLTPLANELSLVEAAMLSFMQEINPRTAVNLLSDYERVLGPDPYGRDTGTLTLQQRQALAYTRWTGKFGARAADFIALAASFGVAISIQQYSVSSVAQGIGDYLTTAPTQYAWVVTLPTPVLTLAGIGSEIGDYFDSFPPSLVQPVIQARAPAQTSPYFSYTG